MLLSDGLIDCMEFISFQTLFHLYGSGRCSHPCFPGVPHLPIPYTNILSKSCLLSYATIVETMVIGERGMNPVATIINAQKEIGQAPGEPNQ